MTVPGIVGGLGGVSPGADGCDWDVDIDGLRKFDSSFIEH